MHLQASGRTTSALSPQKIRYSTDEGDPRGGYDYDEFEHENWHYISVTITTDGSWLLSIIKEPNAKNSNCKTEGRIEIEQRFR